MRQLSFLVEAQEGNASPYTQWIKYIDLDSLSRYHYASKWKERGRNPLK